KQQDALFLADVVFDGTKDQCKAEAKLAQEELGTRRQQLSDLRVAALNLLNLYGQELPSAPTASEEPKPPGAEAPPTVPARKSFDDEKAAAERPLAALRELGIPRIFVGVAPYLYVGGLCVAAG